MGGFTPRPQHESRFVCTCAPPPTARQVLDPASGCPWRPRSASIDPSRSPSKSRHLSKAQTPCPVFRGSRLPVCMPGQAVDPSAVGLSVSRCLPRIRRSPCDTPALRVRAPGHRGINGRGPPVQSAGGMAAVYAAKGPGACACCATVRTWGGEPMRRESTTQPGRRMTAKAQDRGPGNQPVRTSHYRPLPRLVRRRFRTALDGAGRPGTVSAPCRRRLQTSVASCPFK